MGNKPLRLLVGTDFSKESEKALTNARALTATAGGTIVLAHVRPVADLRAAVVEELGDLIRKSGPGELKRLVQEHYETKLQRLVKGSRESILVLKGESAWALAREAARGYDYLVIATRGLGGAASLVMGSTARAVVWHSKTPVIVVPTRR
jgi:nucleotide-binding universal stress UspA family protein